MEINLDLDNFLKIPAQEISRTLTGGVTKLERYNEIVDTVINTAKDKFGNNFYIIANSMWLPIFAFSPKFKVNLPDKIDGCYLAGELDGSSVYISPVLTECDLGIISEQNILKFQLI